VIAFITVTLAEVAPEWIPLRREIIAREGYAVRGGGCASGFTIEVKSLTTNEWQPCGWHHGAACFATEAERDEVLRQIMG
jgi:hypothetical protein